MVVVGFDVPARVRIPPPLERRCGAAALLGQRGDTAESRPPEGHAGTGTKRRLLVIARGSRKAAELEFIAAPGEENLEDRMVVLAERGGGTPTEHEISLRLLRHYASSVYHQQHRETNKALLMQHLTDSGAEGAPIRDLLQALPALSRDQVKRLLRELAVEGRAQVIGVTRAGRWFAIGKAGRIGSAGDDDPKKLQ